MARIALVWAAALVMLLNLLSVRGVMVGGKREIPADDEGVKKAAKYAIEHWDQGDAVTSYKVKKAEKQVVAGLMYHLVLEAESSDGTCTVHNIRVWDHFGEWSAFDRAVTPC